MPISSSNNPFDASSGAGPAQAGEKSFTESLKEFDDLDDAGDDGRVATSKVDPTEFDDDLERAGTGATERIDLDDLDKDSLDDDDLEKAGTGTGTKVVAVEDDLDGKFGTGDLDDDLAGEGVKGAVDLDDFDDLDTDVDKFDAAGDDLDPAVDKFDDPDADDDDIDDLDDPDDLKGDLFDL
jgi:hypothetical protein